MPSAFWVYVCGVEALSFWLGLRGEVGRGKSELVN